MTYIIPRPARILVVIVLAAFGVDILMAADFHVSPNGNDQNDGTEAEPFESLQRAQLAAREKAGTEPVTVWLENGIYYLPQAFTLTHEDSGSEQHPVTYRGRDNGAIISGGLRLELQWTPYENGVYAAQTPDGLTIDQLFIDGQRQHMARYPNFDPNVAHFNGFAADAFSKERAAHWKSPAGGFIEAARCFSTVLKTAALKAASSINSAETRYSSTTTIVTSIFQDVTFMMRAAMESVSSAIQRRFAIRCSIYEVPRAGINISEGTFGGHVIEFCDVFDTVLETGDHGSFNSWGRDRFWGLKDTPEDQLPELAKLDMVDDNIIRNSRWRCDHGWDIDLDDGSSNYHVYNNLLLAGGLKFREGFNRVAENNIMVNNSFHPHVWYKNSGDVVRHNIVFTEYRPIRVPVPWGSEVDKNLLHQPDAKTSRPADVLATQSGRDEHSIIADVMFVNPEVGDFRVNEGSPALELGFVNFPMDQFGVQLPELKELARTPVIPNLKQVSGAGAVVASAPIEHFWNGATIRNLTGEEFSSFGVSKESGGVHLSNVPVNTEAARCGFQTNDLIQNVNDLAVKSVTELQTAQNRLSGKPMRVIIVRRQKEQVLEVQHYSWFTTHNSNDPSFESLNVAIDATIRVSNVTTRPATQNQPPSILIDKQLTQDYGPVFGNGQSGGIYKISLGQSRSIKSIVTATFNQNGNRGAQRFVVYGSNTENDPGWELNDRKVFEPIGEVNTTGLTAKNFQATEIRSSDGSLGQFRWLMWVVYPVTKQGENSAFQEFSVTE